MLDEPLTQDGHLLGGEGRLASAHGRSDAIASHWSGAVACVAYGVCEGGGGGRVGVWVRGEGEGGSSGEVR